MILSDIKSLEIKSSLDEVAIVGLSCRALAEALPFNETEVYEIELAVVEAVTNCIEHAYEFQAGNSIQIRFETNAEEFVIIIEDFGRYWPNFGDNPNIKSAFEFDPEDIDSLPEGGMGVALLFTLMDEVRYNREDGRNTLYLIKRISGD